MRLTIGMPVFNGERFLGQAVESLLAQTWGDFELLIADNASTDATEDICRALAASDRRIRYVRHERNLGAAANFNFVFHRSEGDLFKWAAHDDVHHPTYLEACVKLIDTRPDAAMCHAMTIGIDESGCEICRHVEQLGLIADRAADRLAALFRTNYPVIVWSVMRRSAVARTRLHGSFLGSDWNFMAEMLMLGPVVFAPDYLFFLRHHAGAFSSTQFQRTSKAGRMAWFDPASRTPPSCSALVAAARFTSAALRHPLAFHDRAACLREIALRFGRRAGRRLGVRPHIEHPEFRRRETEALLEVVS